MAASTTYFQGTPFKAECEQHISNNGMLSNIDLRPSDDGPIRILGSFQMLL
jgi:hypothetical protein